MKKNNDKLLLNASTTSNLLLEITLEIKYPKNPSTRNRININLKKKRKHVIDHQISFYSESRKGEIHKMRD